MKWRYAVKVRLVEKISSADLETLEEAVLLSPSSFGIQPYKVFVITDPGVREKLKPTAYNQPAITDASHLFVFAYKKTLDGADVDRFISRIAEVRGQTHESLAGLEASVKGTIDKSVASGRIETWNSRQAYIALGFLLETTALLKIDSHRGGFIREKV